MSHSFTIAGIASSFDSWAAAKAAAIALQRPVDVVRDDGKFWTVGAVARAQSTNRTPVQSAQAEEREQILNALSKINHVLDGLNARLEALETKRRARSAKA
jgi:hypothetical protein